MVYLSDVSPPTEGVQLQQPNTVADVGGQDFGNGTLYIAESAVIWQRESDGRGLNIQYPSINCHAVSRDLDFFPHECLHLIVEHHAEAVGQGDEENEEYEAVVEVHFIPLDKSMLQSMYTAMAFCQGLHPDPIFDGGEHGDFDDHPEEDMPEEEPGEDFYYVADEGMARLTAEGRVRLAEFDAMLGDDCGDALSDGMSNDEASGQFQDADVE